MKTKDDFHFVMPVSSAGTLCGDALADNFTDDVGGFTVTDTVCMSKYKTAYFLLHWGVGATGTFTVTALPLPSVGGGATTAIPFQYKRCSSTETNTAWARSSSLLITAGSNQLYVIKVQADDLPLVAGVKYEYVQLKIVEGTDSPLLGGCIIMMTDARYDEATLDAVTA